MAEGGSDTYEKVQEELRQIDVYRDTPIRFLGYSNEVGEAFRSIVPVSVVRATYVAAFGYVCADALDKSRKAHKKEWPTSSDRSKAVAVAAGDTFLWQTLASVVIPGFTINRLCHFTTILLRKTTRLPPTARKWATTAIGLGAIPLIVRPIDSAVEMGMDSWIRPIYGSAHHGE
ncbi:mtp-18 [Pristionchus pacificus]|uniref:Mitochondrial fission process protein 1 n=1 Tax=Pristionchus pacificus TaxID=54126 RepID=A0A2A6CZS8_PRIPA|nr:mtp-18 [Pristionchus pacificus]|eukprot:PDM83567.1 mtp-18 [Pristionchus pacificus]